MSNPESVRARIEDLRRVMGSVTGEDADVLKAMEKSIKKHELHADWNNHAVTRMIKQELKERVIEISAKLSTDRHLSEDDRRDIFNQKDVYIWILDLFSKGSDTGSLSRIEKDLDENITRFNRFNAGL